MKSGSKHLGKRKKDRNERKVKGRKRGRKAGRKEEKRHKMQQGNKDKGNEG